MTSTHKIYQLKPDVVFQPMDDEAIIVSLNSEEIFKLNLTGTEIVKLIQAATPMDDILPRLAAQFNIDESEIHEEVTQLIEQLLKAGLIEEVKTA